MSTRRLQRALDAAREVLSNRVSEERGSGAELVLYACDAAAALTAAITSLDEINVGDQFTCGALDLELLVQTVLPGQVHLWCRKRGEKPEPFGFEQLSTIHAKLESGEWSRIE